MAVIIDGKALAAKICAEVAAEAAKLPRKPKLAAVLVGNASVLGYAPILLLCALIAGTLTGLVFRAVLPALQKATKSFIQTPKGKE